ncbi:hypothetical protein BJ138DRAFT_781825 [Hygrophoropsis aurantiaca]|uniref:Uncharacterized protein n=1 Tax=Hygrophoropsis aurantiaca TaxID=72124 RepID=A0ACB8AIW2_9AGAM|nr:hypothetical protein BJ138DRAFT_781825 [Hygrophoropsis aurantiaca]
MLISLVCFSSSQTIAITLIVYMAVYTSNRVRKLWIDGSHFLVTYMSTSSFLQLFMRTKFVFQPSIDHCGGETLIDIRASTGLKVRLCFVVPKCFS